MKTRIVIALLSVTACLAAHAQQSTPSARLQACNVAMQRYDAAAQAEDLQAKAQAKSRVIKACYPVSGRAPTVQPPISVGMERQAAEPVKPAPTAQTLVIPGPPNRLTVCDAGGCWDNLGNRYHRTGATLYGPAGKPCIRNGDWIECR
jgi:hypothetical protein